jgi:uncharacterized membrane protein
MWSNLFLLFWLSLIPFGTSWIGSQRFGMIPTFAYGFILLMCAVSYFILQLTIIHQQGPESVLAKALQNDFKGKISLAFHLIALPIAFVAPMVSEILYITVALSWIIPDKRIEKHIN